MVNKQSAASLSNILRQIFKCHVKVWWLHASFYILAPITHTCRYLFGDGITLTGNRKQIKRLINRISDHSHSNTAANFAFYNNRLTTLRNRIDQTVWLYPRFNSVRYRNTKLPKIGRMLRVHAVSNKNLQD